MANFIINLLIVSVVTGILAVILKLTAPFFKNKYTCFLKQLVWIVLAIRLIVPLNYDNTFFTLNSKLYESDDVVTYSMTSMTEDEAKVSTYVAPYRKDSLPKQYSGENKIYGYDTTSELLSETLMKSNEEYLYTDEDGKFVYPSPNSHNKEEYYQNSGTGTDENVSDNVKMEPVEYIRWFFVKSLYQINSYINPIIYIYCAGVLAFLLFHFVAYIALLIKINRKSELIGTERARNILNEIAEEKGLKNVPMVYYMKDINSPMAVGFFKHKILLPEAEYTDKEFRAVFSHEITHILHNDLRIKWIYLFANALHWFNPLIYMMVREASLDMELYCDYSVIENNSEDERMEYNELLISILKNHNQSDKQSLLTTHFKGGVKEMKKRFLSNLDMRKKKIGIIPTVILICVIVLSAGLFKINTIEAVVESEESSFWSMHGFSQKVMDEIYYAEYNRQQNDFTMNYEEENMPAKSYYLKTGNPLLPMQPNLYEDGSWEIPEMYNDDQGYVYVYYYTFQKDGKILDEDNRIMHDKKRSVLSEVPKVSIYCGAEKIKNYGVKINHWDVDSEEFVSTKETDNSDEDNFFLKQAPLTEENPLVTVGTWGQYSETMYLHFKDGEQPDLINVQDTVLTDDGHIRYPDTGFEVIYRLCPVDENTKFEIMEHYSIEQYEDWVSFEDLNHPFNRGYRINCYWNTVEGMQSCTYYVVIRTQSSKYADDVETEEAVSEGIDTMQE